MKNYKLITFLIFSFLVGACDKVAVETQADRDKKAALEAIVKDGECKYKMNGEPVTPSPKCPSKKK